MDAGRRAGRRKSVPPPGCDSPPGQRRTGPGRPSRIRFVPSGPVPVAPCDLTPAPPPFERHEIADLRQRKPGGRRPGKKTRAATERRAARFREPAASAADGTRTALPIRFVLPPPARPLRPTPMPAPPPFERHEIADLRQRNHSGRRPGKRKPVQRQSVASPGSGSPPDQRRTGPGRLSRFGSFPRRRRGRFGDPGAGAATVRATRNRRPSPAKPRWAAAPEKKNPGGGPAGVVRRRRVAPPGPGRSTAQRSSGLRPASPFGGSGSLSRGRSRSPRRP